LLGAVVNNVEHKRGRYGYYGRYQSGYGYGYGGHNSYYGDEVSTESSHEYEPEVCV